MNEDAMEETNVQIHLNIRVVEEGAYQFSFPYGNAEATAPEDGASQGGRPVQTGSSAIAQGLSIPVG
jgi:hypothetical protein